MMKEIFNDILQKRGLSLYKVAKETGIPQSMVYEWASGKREPVSKYLFILADYLNVSVDYLLGRSDTDISVRDREPTGVDEKTRQMTELFNSLDDKGQKAVINLMKSLLE